MYSWSNAGTPRKYLSAKLQSNWGKNSLSYCPLPVPVIDYTPTEGKGQNPVDAIPRGYFLEHKKGQMMDLGFEEGLGIEND